MILETPSLVNLPFDLETFQKSLGANREEIPCRMIKAVHGYDDIDDIDDDRDNNPRQRRSSKGRRKQK